MSAHKPAVVVTRPLPADLEARFDHDYTRRVPDGPLTTDSLVALADGAAAVVVSPGDRVDGEFFARVADSVRIVATRSVGFDSIDVAAA